jgi:class 3 adenylate cyclase/tetratricopeptide (TPR) repeat protein
MGFCGKCGAQAEKSCPSCEFPNPSDFSFCGKCGHDLTLSTEPVPRDLSFDEKIAKIQRYLPEGLTDKILSQRDRIEGERKQVTVMFCDMEGFTALTERLGPEEAYNTMDQIYEILIHKVHDYEGTVNEMTGDGIVALFGAPIALEDAPQRAIRSGLAIHRQMTRFSDGIRRGKTELLPLKMRVGIHTGPVVVGTLGNDLRVDFKAVGDTVNLASRMEELAQPGTTYVTEDTFQLTEGLFRFEALGAKEVKGKEEPVQVYQVIAPSTRRTRFDVSAERGLTPFVGRERELELLLDGLERAKTGRGQAFSIVAEAGVGKSRLLYEFRKVITNEDMTFLEGKSLSYSRGVSYHPVIDILKSNFDIREEDRPFQIAEKVKSALQTLSVDEADTLPYLLGLLSVEENGVESVPLSPETRKERIIEAIRTIVIMGSETRPLIMAFEDLHWVDKSSEDVFRTLLESIAGAKVLLIFTYRPEFVHTWGGKSYHNQLTLGRLSNREALTMVAHLLATDRVDRTLEELILDKTEGVPFFIEEFVKSLKQLSIISVKDKRYSIATDVREVAIPSTIQDVIMARVDTLDEGSKEVLLAGSVIDREFSYDLIKRVTGLPEQELLSRLSGLRDSELLYERGIYPRSTYVFKHALTQEVAYNGLLSNRRKEMHEKIAESIEELYSERLEEYYELLAYHYVRSDNETKAVEFLDLANQKAAKATALEDAKTYFYQAMELLDELPETIEIRRRRIVLLTRQRDVFNLLFQMREYYGLLTRYEQQAIGLGDPSLLGSFYTSLGLCEFVFGHFDNSIETTKKAIGLCEEAGQDEEVVFTYWVLTYGYAWSGSLEQALRLTEKVLPKLDEKFDLRNYVAFSCAALFANLYLGRWNEAIQYGENALRAARDLLDNNQISYAATRVATAYSFKGDMNQALEYAKLAIEKGQTVAVKVWAQAVLGLVWCRTEEVKKGIELTNKMLQALRIGDHVPSEVLYLLVLGEGYLLDGQYENATRTAHELLEIAQPCPAPWYVGCAHRLLGEISLRTNPNEAETHLKKAISIFREIKAENQLALAYSGMGRYHKQQGNVENAKEYLTDALEIFERLGTLIEPDKLTNELAELPQIG